LSIMLLLPALLASAAASKNVTVYFGNGCFWARQHEFITNLEQKVLGRLDSQLTSIAAYAGGTLPASGQLCYENANGTDPYASYGAAEVVSLILQPAQVELAARVYFATFVELQPGIWGRPDLRDLGAEYRALIGVPGGLSGPHGAALRAANVNNQSLTVDDAGSQPDTIGTDRVYVMDSTRFPAVQAEICLQCHDDALVKYSDAYHLLNGSLVRNGRLRKTGCPTNYVC